MHKLIQFCVSTCIAFYAISFIPSTLSATSSFPLSKKMNGIDGIVEVSTINHKFSKIKILDENNKEIEEYQLEGRNARLDRINGRWQNGPLFFVTPDLSIGMGSYNGPYSQPFQIRQGHIQWAKFQKKDNKNLEPIYLPKTLKTEWKVEKTKDDSEVEIFEVSCVPDFDHTPDNAEEMKFKRTFRRYAFDGNNWQQFSRSEDGCWETGSHFPDRKLFP